MAKNGLTKRAVDWRDSARFTSIFLASGFFYSQALSKPARQPLTQTVGRYSESQKGQVMKWRDAVVNALQRFSARHGTVIIERQALIHEEMPQIIRDTNSVGATPEQTLSRILQELRNDGLIYFRDYSGTYILIDEVLLIFEK